MGPEGRGLSFNCRSNITMITGTFGKAFGSGGAFIASNSENGEYLIQTSGAFRYTTALAPSLAAGALEGLKKILKNKEWGNDLLSSAMMTGYFLRQMEQRKELEQTLKNDENMSIEE